MIHTNSIQAGTVPVLIEPNGSGKSGYGRCALVSCAEPGVDRAAGG
jgi:hypothetical protein